MHLRTLHLRHIRAHTETRVDLPAGTTVFVGPNGAGKTNLLEAAGYLGLGKSVLGASDGHVMQRGAPFFSVEGEISGESRGDARVRVAVVPGEGKRAFVNGAPLERLSELVGSLPLVFISPADYDLTAGGPTERRRLLDATLSQAYPVYLDDLLVYRRALKQRNALLTQLRRGASLPPGTLDAWDEELAVRGARIVARRREFLVTFEALLTEAYGLLDAMGAAPSIRYAPSVPATGDDVGDLRRGLRDTSKRGLAMGRTLVGPHLDEADLTLDGFPIRPFASQGQHRLFGLGLRLAQALFFRRHHDETPLLLLDDIFGTLDPHRSGLVLALLASRTLGQALVTSARVDPFAGCLVDDDQVFHVEHGTVTPAPLPLSP